MNDLLTQHLTEEQISILLLANPAISATDLLLDAHLGACARCSGELAQLRQSLANFREAATVHAARQPFHRPPADAPERSSFLGARSLALWSVVAATLAVALSTPLVLHRRQPAAVPAAVSHNQTQVPLSADRNPAPRSTESDEELLTSIDQDISASIPASMQPLADPLSSAPSSSTSK